jgi:hypothetical protein
MLEWMAAEPMGIAAMKFITNIILIINYIRAYSMNNKNFKMNHS